ncbi:hypothetical protein QBC37DRAFT_369940 [Rhypophila decipiens]|uniref:Uncharacterized protein n=1 Tax=Rhypophila decipiens TaxID=261697 RepID=A0AAN6YF85_9PEZI|nr:hypothetical protein QBC37DRAFT_369940 [Rhypophila decipiens]
MSFYTTGEASDTFGGEKSLAISSNNLGHVSQAVHANMNVDYAAQDGLLERTVTYSQRAPDVWQGTCLTPMNPGRVRSVPAAQEDPPTPTSSEKEFEDYLRLNNRAEGGGNAGATFDETDPWLVPSVADRDLTETQREIRRGVLLRDAQNRVVRRPFILAPGVVSRGVGLRDTSPTPLPRRRQNQMGSQAQEIMPSVSSTTRPVEYQQILPPSANQSGYSAMVGLGGVGDHGNGVYAPRREPLRPSSNYEYSDASLDNNRAMFSPPVYSGRSKQTSTYDSTCGTWNNHVNASGGHDFYNGHGDGWANYANPVWQPGEFTPSELYLTGSHVIEEGQAETVYDSMGNPTHD